MYEMDKGNEFSTLPVFVDYLTCEHVFAESSRRRLRTNANPYSTQTVSYVKNIFSFLNRERVL